MIDFAGVKVGDRCRIVGAGAPGYAMLGDVVTIVRVGSDRVDVVDASGAPAYFALTCGAARLELVEAGEHPTTSQGTPPEQRAATVG